MTYHFLDNRDLEELVGVNPFLSNADNVAAVVNICGSIYELVPFANTDDSANFDEQPQHNKCAFASLYECHDCHWHSEDNLSHPHCHPRPQLAR